MGEKHLKQPYLEAGKIINTFGVRGEVKLQPWCDDAEFLLPFKTLYLDGAPLRVRSSRVHKGMLMVHFEGVDDVNAAMALKNKVVSIRRSDAALPHGAFFLQDILGAKVVDEDGHEIGVLQDVMETPASNIYVVRGETEHLIPAVPEFIKKTDAEAGVITVHLIEGM